MTKFRDNQNGPLNGRIFGGPTYPEGDTIAVSRCGGYYSRKLPRAAQYENWSRVASVAEGNIRRWPRDVTLDLIFAGEYESVFDLAPVTTPPLPVGDIYG